MNILVTSAGQRVSLVRAFQAEVKKVDAGTKVFAVDMSPTLSAACNVADGYFKVKPVSDEQYIPELIALCKEQSIGMVVPTIDTELPVLSQNKDKFHEAGIDVIISDAAFVKTCRDKRATAQFFLEHNVDVPQLYTKELPVFPFFIKPYDGSLSADTYIIKKPEDITTYHLENNRLIFMEYIDSNANDEYTIDLYYGRDNNLKCVVPRKRMLVRAGEINKGITEKNSLVPYIVERLGHIAGAVGCLTMQVFLNRNTGVIKGIEINPRFGGGYPLSYCAGANYPGFLIKEYFNNEPVAYTDDWESNLLMLRYDDEILVHDYQANK